MKATKGPSRGRSTRRNPQGEPISDDPLAGLGLDSPVSAPAVRDIESKPACDHPDLEQYAGVVSLSEAARKLVPGGTHPATLNRWIVIGVRNIKLRSYKIGGRRMISPKDLADFLQKLNEPSEPDPRDSARISQQAGDALEKLGC